MNPIEELMLRTNREFPKIKTEFEKADDPQGYQMLTIYGNECHLSVEWKPGDKSIGLSVVDYIDPIKHFFAPPENYYPTVDEAFHRITNFAVFATKPGEI